jgi:tellurite resistance protein TehA-like permease
MALTQAARVARPRWWPAGLAWALWTLTVLGLVATAWLDRLLRRAGAPELTALPASGVPMVAAAVSAVTVGAVLATRRPRHLVGWLLVGLGLSSTAHDLFYGYTRYGLVARPGSLPGPPTWPGSTTASS